MIPECYPNPETDFTKSYPPNPNPASLIQGSFLRGGTPTSGPAGLNRIKKAHSVEKKKTIPAYVIDKADMENIEPVDEG